MEALRWLKNDKVIQAIMVIGLLGIALIMAGSILNPGPAENGQREDNPHPIQENIVSPGGKDQYELALEKDLASILSRIQGVGTVEVDVTLETSFQKHYLFNENTDLRTTEERDASGGTRVVKEDTEDREVVVLQSGQGQEALLENQDYPVIKGVLVVAEGANSIKVKADLIYAVRTLLDISLNKIMVLPYQER